MVKMDRDALESGWILSHPPPDEEVVISGQSGVFPCCDTTTDFAEKLFKKENFINGFWSNVSRHLPKFGKLNHHSKFDAGFFGIHYKQAHTMDPMSRIVLEQTAAAIFDAGYNPRSFYGKNVGVFVGVCFSETEKSWLHDNVQVNGMGITGCVRSAIANRISYWLGVNGPSYTVDTACSSSIYAIDHGYRAIREGICDTAIVAGVNLCLNPLTATQFYKLGVLSDDGKCKSFDETADGYGRSEAISVMILQRRKDARRIYATIVHVKTNCDGYKEEGITFPSGPVQQILLEEFYQECQVNPSELAWLEAHGTGTKVGDPAELGAIENVFCPNRKEPLKIGSLKSNCGHSEPVSALLSVTKVIVAMECGFIPPNINITVPRKDVEAFHNGKIKIITEKTSWSGGLVGVNSFGFGGANGHLLLKSHDKTKINNSIPSDDLPRLVCVSGRTSQAVVTILSHLENNPLDAELVTLYHHIFKREVPGHLYRGYTIISKSNKLGRSIKECSSMKQPFTYFFPGCGFKWKILLDQLMEIPMILGCITECCNILKKENFDLHGLMSEKSNNKRQSFNVILMECIGQIILARVLKNLGLEPDCILGTSYGEIACAYADGSLTFDQAVLSSYVVAKALSQLDGQGEYSAVIGLPHNVVKTFCSSKVTCTNRGEHLSLVSGPEADVKIVIEKAEFNNAGYILTSLPALFNNNNTAKMKTSLHQQLRKIIKENRISSPKWISTSINNKKGCISFATSPEYFCNALINPFYLEGWLSDLQKNSVIIEFSPEPLIGRLPNTIFPRQNLPFIQILSACKDSAIVSLLDSLGKMGNSGGNLDLNLIYPVVELPVSRSTPMISPLIQWDHERDWFVVSHEDQNRTAMSERTITLSLKEEDYECLFGHNINGKILFPATGYLFLVWDTLSADSGKHPTDVPVVIENVRFIRATNMPKDEAFVGFTITIQKSSGYFEIMESGATIVTGTIRTSDDISKISFGLPEDFNLDSNDDVNALKAKDIYKELRLRGYNYSGLFKSISCSSLDGTMGFIKWQNNWISFMDNMLQMQILNTDSRGLFVPTGITRVVINPKKHMAAIQQLTEDNKDIPVYNSKRLKLVRSGGIEFRGLHASAINKKKNMNDPVLEKYQFFPYHYLEDVCNLNQDDIIRLFVHIVLENQPTISVKVHEIGEITDDYDTYLSQSIIKALTDLPLIQDCVQGLEFSGRLANGKKIMGMVPAKGIANVIDSKHIMSWDVPDSWTLEEAATVPCVYTTIIYAFNIVGHPKKGDTILVHAGTGGIGQATIHYALHHGCEVFTTVGTPEKREFIKNTFPQLTDNHIGNSRDTSFEELILRETDGLGVDFVLNSLAEEKLLASVRCLAKGGRFLELGKFDIANNSPLGMEFLVREASFHGIMLDVRSIGDNKSKNSLWNLVNEAINKGACIPLTRTVFKRDQVENAFRYMGAGKHIGKVLIEIREEETSPTHSPKPLPLKATPRFYCDANKSYVVLGGLGGFGLELADWLILREARHIILSSRSGVKEGYQSMRINLWQSYGATVDVFTDDVTTEEGVMSLLNKSNEVAPVGGIFNLAVVLSDAIFDNQNEKEFIKSFGPKAIATKRLDRLSRNMCPQLEQFVVFSSVSCGRGNAGQTNYGMSNSIMERICEQRHIDGLPAIAIQWGAVGDVGLVANMAAENTEVVIGGTLPQKIDSCLSVMDLFLNEKFPIVASMVVAEKTMSGGAHDNIVETILEIIGIKDIKLVGVNSSLGELGMDSMMAVEIKQTLERDFEVFLTPQDMRGMTIAKLQEIVATKSSGDSQAINSETTNHKEDIKLITDIGDEAISAIPVIKHTALYIEGNEASYDNRIFFLPGIEGFASVFQTLCTKISYDCYCVQYDIISNNDSIEKIAKEVYERIHSYIHKDHVIRLVGYSFGGMVSLELVKLLQDFGYQTKLCILDGSPDIFKLYLHFKYDTSSEETFQQGVVLSMIDLLLPEEKNKVEPIIKQQKSWEGMAQVALDITKNISEHSDEYKINFATSIYKRLQSVDNYQGVAKHSLKSQIKLLKPKENMINEYQEDYGLSKYFDKEVEAHVVDGDHLSMLNNIETANHINSFMSV